MAPDSATTRALLLRCERSLTENILDPEANHLLAELARGAGFEHLANRYWAAADPSTFRDTRGSSAPPPDVSKMDHPDAERDPYLCGTFSFFCGDFEAARRYLSAAAEALPESGDLALHLARAMVASGATAVELVEFLSKAQTNSRSRTTEIKAELAYALARGGASVQVGKDRLTQPAGDNVYQTPSESEREWYRHFDILRFKTAYEGFIPACHETYRRVVSRYVDEHRPACVLNFGVLCGKTDYEIASTHPRTQFIGVDWAPELKRLNDAHFSHANLSFQAANIFDVLDHLEAPQQTVLVHMRTAQLVDPATLLQLYQKAAARGIRGIIALENWSLRLFPSSYSGSYVRFMHNYVELLAQVGYTVESARIEPFALLWKHFDMMEEHFIEVVGRLAP